MQNILRSAGNFLYTGRQELRYVMADAAPAAAV
jgi:hypothetical protein